MSDIELLKTLGWSEDLIAEYQRASADITAGLPHMTLLPYAANGESTALVATETLWSAQPAATDSLFVGSARR